MWVFARIMVTYLEGWSPAAHRKTRHMRQVPVRDATVPPRCPRLLRGRKPHVTARPASGVGRYVALRGARHAQRWGLTLFILRLAQWHAFSDFTIGMTSGPTEKGFGGISPKQRTSVMSMSSFLYTPHRCISARGMAHKTFL